MEESSPVPQKDNKVMTGEVLLNFPQAMESVIAGKKVSRIEWNDTNTYGMLQDGFLMLSMNNTNFKWIVSDGDILATDWIALPESN